MSDNENKNENKPNPLDTDLQLEIALRKVQKAYGKEWNEVEPNHYRTTELDAKFEKLKPEVLGTLKNPSIPLDEIRKIVQEIDAAVTTKKYNQDQIKIAKIKAEENERKAKAESEKAEEDKLIVIPDFCKNMESLEIGRKLGFYMKTSEVKTRRSLKGKTQLEFNDIWFMLTPPTDTSTTSASFKYYIGKISKIRSKGKPDEVFIINYEPGKGKPTATMTMKKEDLKFFAEDFPRANYFYEKYIQNEKDLKASQAEGEKIRAAAKTAKKEAEESAIALSKRAGEVKQHLPNGVAPDTATLSQVEEAEAAAAAAPAAASAPASAPSSTAQSSTAQSSTAQSSTAQSSTAQSSTAQSSTAQSSTAQSSTAQSSTAQSSTAQSSTAQSSAAQSSTAQSSAAQSITSTDKAVKAAQEEAVKKDQADKAAANKAKRQERAAKVEAAEKIAEQPRNIFANVPNLGSHIIGKTLASSGFDTGLNYNSTPWGGPKETLREECIRKYGEGNKSHDYGYEKCKVHIEEYKKVKLEENIKAERIELARLREEREIKEAQDNDFFTEIGSRPNLNVSITPPIIDSNTDSNKVSIFYIQTDTEGEKNIKTSIESLLMDKYSAECSFEYPDTIKINNKNIMIITITKI